MLRQVAFLFLVLTAFVSVGGRAAPAAENDPLPGTEKLTLEGDISTQLVEGVDKFLLRKTEEVVKEREELWQRDVKSLKTYEATLAQRRERLARILGVREPRVPFVSPELMATVKQPALIATGTNFDVFAVRWPVLEDPDPKRSTVSVYGEGLLLVPRGQEPIADVIALPDADQTPEQLVGISKGVEPAEQFARRLAESGCRVLVPTLIDRHLEKRSNRANLTNREFIYRSAFEMGRHIIGYEVQKTLAAVDWFAREQPAVGQCWRGIGIIGYGEGGLVALTSAALDTRIGAVCVGGYFGSRQNMWQEPIDRNLFGYLREFGDAELAALVVSHTSMVIYAGKGPEVTLPSEGGAPGRLVTPTLAEVDREVGRVEALTFRKSKELIKVFPTREKNEPETSAALDEFYRNLAPPADRKLSTDTTAPKLLGLFSFPDERQRRQLQELDRYNQQLLAESPYVRAEFMKKLDTSSIEKYKETVEGYREIFQRDVIGWFDDPLLDPYPRTREKYSTDKFTGYEVVLDVWPDVIAYGILLVPKNISTGEKRPVVVCQHGLEGRPQDVVTGNLVAYHDFAAKLAERGYVTFAPQNLYLGKDKFRTLQRKANPLGRTLFSVIIPQHRQVVKWLGTLPFVDADRMGFYGLSYGGKSAMRIPPLVPEYKLSICSADFNDWVDKNASTRGPYSYVWTGEYEIFEFDLGSTFNYSEMAALICPRPFMVERGHFDGVGTDERVAFEFAKVRNLYAARLKQPQENCTIEWFVGPHTINGKGSFEFLDRHLKPAKK